jgi:hypothetical protein
VPAIGSMNRVIAKTVDRLECCMESRIDSVGSDSC